MSAADTVKDVVRIASTAGLAKDVIDLLEKKVTLLAAENEKLEKENTTLLRENRNLTIENQQLKTQVQRPKGDELDQKTQDVLKYIFDKGDDFSDQEIAQRFQMQMSVAGYYTDILFRKKLIRATRIGIGDSPPMMGITEQGRKYIVENRLAD